MLKENYFKNNLGDIKSNTEMMRTIKKKIKISNTVNIKTKILRTRNARKMYLQVIIHGETPSKPGKKEHFLIEELARDYFNCSSINLFIQCIELSLIHI